MNTYIQQKQTVPSRSVFSKRSNQSHPSATVDGGPETLLAKGLQSLTHRSVQARQAMQLQVMADNYAQRQLSFRSTHIPHAPRNVVQRAGHPEDLYILENRRWVIKRIDEAEKDQYNILRTRFSMVDPDPSPIPHFLGPFGSPSDLENVLNAEDISSKDREKLAAMSVPAGKYLLVMSNVTGGEADVIGPIDVKFGKHTANKEDLRRRGKGWWKRQTKLLRHDIMDKNSPSRLHGFRDEDAWKARSKWKVLFLRRKTNINANLNQFRSKLKQGSAEALSKLIPSLELIQNFLNHVDTVYVGSSILIVLNNENPDKSTAKLIDFEHPLTSKDEDFDTVKKGLLDGIARIKEEINDLISNADSERSNVHESPDQPLIE